MRFVAGIIAERAGYPLNKETKAKALTWKQAIEHGAAGLDELIS